MFKKLIVTGATAGLLLVSATGVFAHHHSMPAPLPTTTVVNSGSIHDTSINVANSGLNYASGRHSSITTGTATASQEVYNGIGTSSIAGAGNISVTNHGSVTSLSVNAASTGLNGVSHGGSIHTGAAGAGQTVTNVVNTSVGPTTL